MRTVTQHLFHVYHTNHHKTLSSSCLVHRFRGLFSTFLTMGQLVTFIIFPVDMNVDLCLSSHCLGRCISVNVVIYLFAYNSACQSQNWSRNVPNVEMTKVFCVSPQDIHCVYYITLATLYNNIVHLTNTCVTFFFYVRNEKATKKYSYSRTC